MVAQPEITTRKKMVADWLALDDEAGHWELLDGELTPWSGSNGEDDMAGGALPNHAIAISRLMLQIDKIKPNGEVFTASVGIYFDEENTPEPDIFWIKEGGRCKASERYFEGAPDLIVEVLSPGTARKDRTTKYELYQKHGVTEYWIADPSKHRVEVYTLVGKKYQQTGIYGDGEAFDSPVLGARVVLIGMFI